MNSNFILELTLLVVSVTSAKGQTFCYNYDQNQMEDVYYDIPEVLESEFDRGDLLETQSDLQTLPECFLDGIPLNTTFSQPYILPPVSDNVNDGEVLWTHPFIGLVNYTAIGRGPGNTSDHSRYISGHWIGGRFTIRSKVITKDFTKAFQTRILYRQIVVYCCPNDGYTRIRYHLNIPLQDMTPPEFQHNEYNFYIPVDWNRELPISEGQHVIVGDNAYEIQNNDSFLQYTVSVGNTLRVVPHRLWARPNPRVFHYQLDLYLEDSVELTAGQHIQLRLTVRDQFNSGDTIVNVYVE